MFDLNENLYYSSGPLTIDASSFAPAPLTNFEFKIENAHLGKVTNYFLYFKADSLLPDLFPFKINSNLKSAEIFVNEKKYSGVYIG